MCAHVPQQTIGLLPEHPEQLATAMLNGAPQFLREPQQQGGTLFVLVQSLSMRGRLFWKGQPFPPGAGTAPLTLDRGGENVL